MIITEIFGSIIIRFCLFMLCFLSSGKYFMGPLRLEQISWQLLLKSPIQLEN